MCEKSKLESLCLVMIGLGSINGLGDELGAQEIELENMIMEMATPKQAFSINQN